MAKTAQSGQVQNPELDSEDTEIVLNSILEELETATDVQCAVYKESGRDSRQCAFMFAFEASDYTFTDLREKVANEYGGGDYRLRVTQGGRLVHNRPFAILARPGAGAPGNPQAGALELLISTIADGQNKILAALTQQKTPAELQRETLENLKLYREALGGNTAQKTDIIEEITRYRAVAEMFNGADTNQNDVILELVKSLGPAVIAAAKNQAVQPKQPKGATVINQSAIDQAEPEGQATQDEASQQKAQLLGLLTVLLHAASRNADPNLYVDLVADTYDDDTLVLMLGNDDWFKLITQYAPAAGLYENWFEEMRERLLLDIKDRQDQEAKEQQEAAATKA